jgi:hypothetical protein
VEKLTTTRFGYQGRGDNPTSLRIYEWVDVGSVPLNMIDYPWLPLRHILWQAFALFLFESSFISKDDDDALARDFECIAYGLNRYEMDQRRRIFPKIYAPSKLWAALNSMVT